MKEEKILYSTSHYKTSFAKEKAKELRKQGYTVKLGYYIKENDDTYCKIYLVKNFEYYILERLSSMQANIIYGKNSIEATTEAYRESIESLCLKYKRSAKIEIDNQKIYAIVDHKEKKKELFVSLRH